MRFKKTILIFSIIIIGFSLFIIPTRADTKTTNSQKAATVLALNPDTNYGNDVDLLVGGTVSTWCKTYIEFDIRNLPSNIQKVTLILNIYDLDAAMELNIYVASDSWSESTITWNNRPSRLESLGTVEITQTAVWRLEIGGLDLTLYGNYITFELDSGDIDFMTIRSDDTGSPPKLEIQHTVAGTTGGLPLGAIIGIVVGIGAAVAVGGFLIIRSRKKKREEIAVKPVSPIMTEFKQPIAVQPITPKEEPIITPSVKPKEGPMITPLAKPKEEPIITRQEKPVEPGSESICPICGSKVVNNFCTACGATTDEFVIENVQKVFESSGIRVNLDTLRSILPMDTSEFNRKIFDLADQFGFKIEMEMMQINEAKKEDFIKALIKALKE